MAEMTFRVIVSPINIHKIKISLADGASVSDMMSAVEAQLNQKNLIFPTNYVLQYLDTDFSDYFNIVDVSSLENLSTLTTVKK